MMQNKFKPILFSTPMVKAILDGRKTMTRRKIKNKDQPFIQDSDCEIELNETWGWVVMRLIETDPPRYEVLQQFKCHYGKVGDVLWVRETWNTREGDLVYKASPDLFKKTKWYKEIKNAFDISIFKIPEPSNCIKWKPSIFMPKSACRIFLEITDVRVERLNEISEEDAKMEGIYFNKGAVQNGYGIKDSTTYNTAVSAFQSLWQSINGNWEENPFVWVVEFKKIDKPENFI